MEVALFEGVNACDQAGKESSSGIYRNLNGDESGLRNSAKTFSPAALA